MTTKLAPVARGLVSAFTVSGVIHLVRPQVFTPLVPRWLPDARQVVHLSGVAELACAAGLAHPRTRAVAGSASAALLVAVWPGNVQMAWDAHRRLERKGWTPAREAMRVGTALRVPLQIPLIRAAWRAGR
ncbi:DoxX family protein [Dermacoccaceae bacterium W4C1]